MRRLDALALHIQQSDCDVVCLQELFVLQFGLLSHVEWFLSFAEKMRTLGLVHFVNPLTNMPSWGQNSGLANLFSFSDRSRESR